MLESPDWGLIPGGERSDHLRLTHFRRISHDLKVQTKVPASTVQGVKASDIPSGVRNNLHTT